MCGYFFLNKLLKVNLGETYGFWISLPIYLTAGIVLYTVILYAIALAVFNESIVILVALAVSLLYLGNVIFSARRTGITLRTAFNRLREINPSRILDIPKQRNKLIPAVIFAVSLVYLTTVIAVFEWPPAGDIVSHGFYTSLIIYDQRIPMSFHPFVNWSFYYPLGLHLDAAFLSLLLGLYPGEAVLLFGGILMIALTSLIFTFTFILTRSRPLSLLAYVLVFLTYSPGSGGGDLENWVFGYLFNGTYPNIFGLLIVLLSLTVIVLHSKTKDEYLLLRLYPVLMIVLLLAYPNFIFVSILLFVLAILQVGMIRAIKDSFRNKKNALLTIVLATAFSYFVLYVYYGIFSVQVSTGGELPAYTIQQSYFLGSLFGYSIILAFVFSFIFVVLGFMKKYRQSSRIFKRGELVGLRPLLLTNLVIIIVLLLSLNSGYYHLVSYLLPDRLAVVAVILSLVLNIYAFDKVSDFVGERLSRREVTDENEGSISGRSQPAPTRRNVLRVTARRDMATKKKIAVILTIVVFFNANGLLLYSIAAQASLSLVTGYAVGTRNSYFDDDFNAMEWIYYNANHGELILNDWSWDGLYLTSLAALNVSMQYEFASFNRTKDLQSIWMNPQLGSTVQTLLKEYNVSYILVTSEGKYYDFLNDRVYKSKPFTPANYLFLFSNYSFLALVFESGDSAVFRVE
jgi:hypothetical protein